MLLSLGIAVLQACFGVVQGQSDFEQQCLAFKPQGLVQNSTLRILEYVPSGANLAFPGNDESCGRTNQIVSNELCRVALTIPTSNRSSIIFEQWFPLNWTGRFLGTGNGGIDGCIKYEDMAYTALNGFAVTGSNNGHNGTGGKDFFHNPDIVTDFSYRSLHTTAVVGKKLVQSFYGKPHTKSYYLGCSGGGRQGLQAMGLYPEDYDGVLAGCPTANFNYLSSWRASFYPITGSANSSDFIKSGTWSGLIHNEVLRQCDGLDGVLDGIIEDPDLCHFVPETLLCGTNQTNSACLSPHQVEIVHKVFSPLYGTQGQLIYPGLQPGAEATATQRLLSGVPFPFSVDWFRYVVFSDPTWDPATFTIADATTAENLNPSNARSWPSSLSAFRDRGGKYITYHGGQDQQMTGFNTELLYSHLADGMDSPPAELDSWFRFFRIPGMGHCGGGPGAAVFGQLGGAASQGIEYRPDRNVLAALVSWVENGTAPGTILGTKFVNDTVGLGVQYRKRHCRYPLRSAYVGGNASDVDSWACR